eukprot:m.18353 g.18353  ORF g.18353 m.18353 type:complete len:338 (+) comp6291_c0_seq1:116-1129(+)
MEQVVLGSGDAALKVSKQGFGCMGITAFYGDPMKDEDAIDLLMETFKSGVTHFDTAEIYRTGNIMAPPNEDTKWNEVVVGKFIAKAGRENIQVATKYFPLRKDGVTPANVREAVEGSLKRLGVDYIDLYYLHRLPESRDPVPWVEAMKPLIAEGKVKYIGLSEAPGDKIRAAHAVHPITAVQQEWSLITRVIEDDIAATCKELGVGVVAYSPLARNMLAEVPTETPKDWRASIPRYSAENLAKNAALVQQIKDMAESKGVSVAVLSLSWLYAKAKELGVTVVPIPGTTKIAHMKTNVTATTVELNAEEVAKMDEIGSTVAGARGDERYRKMAAEGSV